MHAEKSNHTVSRMARLLEVSRSGFYAWSKRLPSKRAVRAERIEAKIAWFHGESDEVSGSPRILADLREDGEVISRKTVAKAMRKLGLRGICPRQWRTTTDTRPRRHLPARWDQAAVGHRGPQRRLGRRHHLPADLGRVAVPGHRDRCPLASRDRMGDRRSHAHRPRRGRLEDGDHPAW